MLTFFQILWTLEFWLLLFVGFQRITSRDDPYFQHITQRILEVLIPITAITFLTSLYLMAKVYLP